MLKLMETDHFYAPNPDVDPAEFIGLFNKFRKDPVFWVGLKGGLNISQPTITKYYNVGASAGGQGSYSFAPSFQVMLVFEKTFPKISNKLVLAPEIGYVSRSYNYSNSNLDYADEDPNTFISSQEFLFSQSYLDLNAIVHYKLSDGLLSKTYVGGGPGASMLLSSGNAASTTLGDEFTVTGQTVDDAGSFNKFIYSFTVMAGGRIKFGDVYLAAEIRYQVGLSNLVDPTSRTSQEMALDYQAQYNDYRLSNVMLNFGVIYPYFKPKKLVR